jgi:hypothetical protein
MGLWHIIIFSSVFASVDAMTGFFQKSKQVAPESVDYDINEINKLLAKYITENLFEGQSPLENYGGTITRIITRNTFPYIFGREVVAEKWRSSEAYRNVLQKNAEILAAALKNKNQPRIRFIPAAHRMMAINDAVETMANADTFLTAMNTREVGSGFPDQTRDLITNTVNEYGELKKRGRQDIFGDIFVLVGVISTMPSLEGIVLRSGDGEGTNDPIAKCIVNVFTWIADPLTAEIEFAISRGFFDELLDGLLNTFQIADGDLKLFEEFNEKMSKLQQNPGPSQTQDNLGERSTDVSVTSETRKTVVGRVSDAVLSLNGEIRKGLQEVGKWEQMNRLNGLFLNPMYGPCKDTQEAKVEIPSQSGSSNEHIQVIFIRHAESIWNDQKRVNRLISKRGSTGTMQGLTSDQRRLEALVRLGASRNNIGSYFRDAKLSAKGIQQAMALGETVGMLNTESRDPYHWECKPFIDSEVRERVLAILGKKGIEQTVIATSNLKRAYLTELLALKDRESDGSSKEKIWILSSTQELSDGADATSLATERECPELDAAEFEEKFTCEPAKNEGDENGWWSFQSTRLKKFCEQLFGFANENNKRMILTGHSSWLQEFYKMFLKTPKGQTQSGIETGLLTKGVKLGNASVIEFQVRFNKESGFFGGAKTTCEIVSGSTHLVFGYLEEKEKKN